jgi:hypothetical protein
MGFRFIIALTFGFTTTSTYKETSKIIIGTMDVIDDEGVLDTMKSTSIDIKVKIVRDRIYHNYSR